MSLLANLLTVLRVVMIPFIIWGLYPQHGIDGMRLALILFIAAGITDYLDGKVARMFNAGSKFGAMLDPIADKILVASVLIMLVYNRQPNGLPRADMIPVIIIICREIVVSGLREFLAMEVVLMPVTKLAKWKTTFQLLALLSLLAAPLVQGVIIFGTLVNLQQAGQILLWIAALLTAITGWQYLRHTMREAFVDNKVFAIKMISSEPKELKDKI